MICDLRTDTRERIDDLNPLCPTIVSQQHGSTDRPDRDQWANRIVFGQIGQVASQYREESIVTFAFPLELGVSHLRTAKVIRMPCHALGVARSKKKAIGRLVR